MADENSGSIKSVAAAIVETKASPPQGTPTPETGQGTEGDDQYAEPPAGDEDEDQGHEPQGTDGEPSGGDEGGEGGEGSDDSPSYRVKVDGVDREVSLSELIKSYTGEGAIAKRLQEATEARAEAQRARDIAIEQERSAARDVIQKEAEALRSQAQQLAAVYQHYGQALLQPSVQMPDPSMQQSDPIGYLTAMEAYRQDQDRLRSQQAHMQEVVQQAEQLDAQARAEFAKAEIDRMQQEVPAMASPEYRKAQAQRVFEVGRAVGFTDQEIRKYATDRRVIYLAMLAAQGAEGIMKTRQGGKPTVTPKAAPPRSTGADRAANGTFRKKAAAVTEQARKTGDYRDVAKTLLVSRKGAPRV